MRPEWRLGIAAAAILAAGAFCAGPYARLATPYYETVDRLLVFGHPWSIREVAVTPDRDGRGTVLRLIGEVRRQREDAQPAAIVVTRLQVGEVIEAPLVFWTLLLLWPAASGRARWTRLAVGAAVFLGLEALTTAVQLLHSMAGASALLVHADARLTIWERWSRFLEAGGDFALAVAAALTTLAAANAVLGGRGARG
jgi:hypothetical protein